MKKKFLIIISGASGGIGQLLIKKLSKKFKILCIYNQKKPKFTKTANFLKIDYDEPSKIKNASIRLKKMTLSEKKIIFLNLAAVKIDKLSIQINKNEMNKTFNVNYFSLFYLVQAILPNLIRNKWGRVINFSSTGGLSGEVGTLLYTSSKHACTGMMKVFSKEFAKFNITFNTIKLGNFDAGMYKKLTKNAKANILKKIPSEKTGDINSIYNSIKFIIGSNYVNGSEVSVDGGFNAS
jgi:3-oxoacyl-[acyl-carrier protein] reductase